MDQETASENQKRFSAVGSWTARVIEQKGRHEERDIVSDDVAANVPVEELCPPQQSLGRFSQVQRIVKRFPETTNIIFLQMVVHT